MTVKIHSPNLIKTVAGLKALIAGIPIAAKQSSRIVAEHVLDLSLNSTPSCPEDTGKLRESGRVEPVKEGYAVLYGGAQFGVDYAAYVHDDLRPRKYKRPGSGPKFVETHMLRQTENAKPKIAAVFNELIENIIRVYR